MSRAPRLRRRRWALAAAVILAIAVPTVVPLFALHRAKARILRTLAGQLGREVSADSLHLVLLPWPGFELYRVRLGEAPEFGIEDLASADDAVATLRLLPLWRGRIEFSSIRLDSATVNLVRNDAGRWNLAGMLDRASAAAPRLRPTAAPAALGAPARFPYLEIRDSRVNFKFGLYKRAFYLSAVNGSLTLERNAWRIHLRFVPQRSDLNLSNTGEVTVDGRWQRPRGAVAFRDLPFDLSAHFTDSYLAGSSPLLLGHDAGVHGIVGADVRLRGTGQAFQLSGVITAAALRRWDQLPSGLRLRVPFAARYRAGDDSLQLEEFGAAARGDLTGFVRHLLTRPAADLRLSLHSLDAGALWPLARALDPRLPAAASLTGTVSAALRIQVGAGAPFSLSGALRGHGLELREGDAALRLAAASCQAAVTFHCQAQGTLAAAPPQTPAILQITTGADLAGWHAAVAAARLDATQARVLARLFGARDPWPGPVRGSASVQWKASLPWTELAGNPAAGGGWQVRAIWARASLRLPQLAAALPCRELRLSRAADGTITLAGTVLADGEPWSLMARRTAPAGAAAAPLAWTFQLRARRASGAAVARALRPSKAGFFASLLSSPPSLAPLLARLRATGQVNIGEFAWRGHHASVQADIAAAGPAWRIAPLTVGLAGGTFRGEGEWRHGLLRLRGAATHINLHALFPGDGEGGGGIGSADLVFETPRPLDFAPLTVTGDVRVSFGLLRFTSGVSWRDGAARFSASRLVSAAPRQAIRDPVPGLMLARAVAPPGAPARAFQAKLDRIEANASSPPPHPDVRLTSAEANAYFASPLSPLPPAVSHLLLSNAGNLVSGSADIDFDKLPERSSLFTGVHHVTAQAHLDSGAAPAAQLTILQVSLDGQRIPNFLIDLAIREFIQPKHPQISRHFSVPLPGNVRSVELGDNQAILRY
ncbi:MAG: AsmA family protein [Terriglobales bacterium]